MWVLRCTRHEIPLAPRTNPTDPCALLSPQPSPPDSFPSCGSKVSSMSLIRTFYFGHVYIPRILSISFLPFLSNVSTYTLRSPAGTSTTVPPASWQRKDFISFTTGLTTGHGILWGGSSVAPFIQVGIKYNTNPMAQYNVSSLTSFWLVDANSGTLLNPSLSLTRADDHLGPPVPRPTLFPHHHWHP